MSTSDQSLKDRIKNFRAKHMKVAVKSATVLESGIASEVQLIDISSAAENCSVSELQKVNCVTPTIHEEKSNKINN